MNPMTVEELRLVALTAWRVLQTEKKDLDAYLVTARCVITSALALAETNPDEANNYKTLARNMSFNIASAAWPGWEDAHENITAEQLALALDMCNFNVEMSETLDAPPDRRANGFWISGAHLLANGKFAEAKAAFEKAAAFNDTAASEDGATMARGWIIVSDILAGEDRKKELDAISDKLKTMGEDGEFYASQYEPAIVRLSRL